MALPRTLARLASLLLVAALFVLVAVAGVLVFNQWTIPRSSARGEIQITNVFLDRVDAPIGNSFYLLELNASNPNPVAWRFDPAFLEMSGNSSRLYHPDPNYNATSTLGVLDLSHGRSGGGLVAFELPNSEVPSRLRYRDPSTGLRFDVGTVPRPSAAASRFNFEVYLSVNGLPVDIGGWTVNRCPAASANGTGPWVCSIIANGVVSNDSLVFFTGQTVKVSLWFEYLRLPADPREITLESVTGGDAFPIVSSQPSLPIVLTGWGSSAGLDIKLKVPAGEHSESLSFSVQFSARG